MFSTRIITCSLLIGTAAVLLEWFSSAFAAPSPIEPAAHSGGVNTSATRSTDPVEHAKKNAPLIGVYMAQEAAELAPTITGRLAELRVRIGDSVKQGELIGRIDTRAQQLDLHMAQARAAQARADWQVSQAHADAASDDAQRTEMLAELGAASQALRVQAQNNRRAATLQQQAARSQLDLQSAAAQRARRDRDEASVLAPFEGLVVARYVDPGMIVNPERALVRVLRRGGMIVRFGLPEERARALAIDSVVEARSVSRLAPPLRAVVRRISPEVDPATGWFIVEAEVDAAIDTVPAGSAADVYITGERLP